MSVTCDRSVVFSIQHYVIKFVSDLWQVGGFLYTTLCDKVCQWLVTGRWFSPAHPVSSTNKTDRHDITEILLKVALNTISQSSCICDLSQCWGIQFRFFGYPVIWPSADEVYYRNVSYGLTYLHVLLVQR